MPEYEILAKKLKKIRKAMNESQLDFAAHCDLCPELVSKIENERTDPKISTLQKIAAYTDLTVSDLLRKEDNEEPHIQDPGGHDIR